MHQGETRLRPQELMFGFMFRVGDVIALILILGVPVIQQTARRNVKGMGQTAVGLHIFIRCM